MPRITVLYLWRRVNDLRYAHAFFRSIRRFPAGAEYDFVFAVKGYAIGDRLPHQLDLAALPCMSAKVMHFADDHTPISIYRAVSRACDTEFILVFNSWSRVLAANWLAHYVGVFDRNADCGLVGATGSHEAAWDQPFPNPAIRSNAFLVRTSLFSAFELGDPKTVLDDHLFEAGPNGMTRQVMARGLVPFVVDRFGTAWPPGGWMQSRTFRVGEQGGLLVADNRTSQYACGSPRKRARLIMRAWGNDGVTSKSSFPRRAAAWLWWHYPRGPLDMIGDGLAALDQLLRRMTGRPANPGRKVFPN
ncbi:hypothetical protein [Labrys neptuniae]|uniref:Uncharacterized protein n=1 Tax=Labrys neptuniae TaxID=376174 RepID=A0ABV3PMZ7_9HYPH